MAWVHVWARLTAVSVSIFLTLDRLQLSLAFRMSSLFSAALETMQVCTGHKNTLGVVKYLDLCLTRPFPWHCSSRPKNPHPLLLLWKQTDGTRGLHRVKPHGSPGAVALRGAGPGAGDLNRLEMHALSRDTGSQSHAALLEHRMTGCQLPPL